MSSFLARPGLPSLAYIRTDPTKVTKSTGLLYLGGYMSTKTGSKVTKIREHVESLGHQVLSFDYTDKGESIDEKVPKIWSMEQWKQDCLTALDQLTTGPQVLIGSSMGAWMALLVATARPDRIKAVVTVAAAVGFTEQMRSLITDEHRATYESGQIVTIHNDYGPMPLSKRMLDDGTALNLLKPDIKSIDINCPVRCLHSMGDDVAPYQCSLDIVSRVASTDALSVIRKGGNHFMQSPEELDVIYGALGEMLNQ